MANSLYTKQNEKLVLCCLVAQRRLYSKAKGGSYAPKIINLILLVFAFTDMCKVNACGWVLAWVAIFSWIMATLGDEYVKILRGRAASIQQYVDREIYREAFSNTDITNWSNIPLTSVLDKEIAGITDVDIDKAKVRNWYSDYSTDLPQEAVFYCQRENLRWDRKLRVIAIIGTLIASIILCVTVMCKVWELKVKDVLPVLIPAAGLASALLTILFGLILDCVRSAQMSAVAAMIELGLQRRENMLSKLVDFQNLIYNNRCSVVFIPDCFYKCFRKLYQKKEDAIAKAHEELTCGQ